MFAAPNAVPWSKQGRCVSSPYHVIRCTFRSRTDSVRSKSPLMASPASPGLLSNSLHGSFHGSLGSDGMSCSSARSSSASPDSARYSSSQVTTSFYHEYIAYDLSGSHKRCTTLEIIDSSQEWGKRFDEHAKEKRKCEKIISRSERQICSSAKALNPRVCV